MPVNAKTSGNLSMRCILFALLAAYTMYNMGPILWLMISSVKGRADLFAMPPKWIFEPDLTGYHSVFGVGAAKGTASAFGVVDSLKNSVVVSVAGTSLAVLFGMLAGYVCSRFKFAGRGDFLFFVLSTRMLPPVAGTGVLPPDVCKNRPGRHADRSDNCCNICKHWPRYVDYERLL